MSPAPALRITSLNKSYGKLRAVQDLSLSVETGSIYGLLGPNGSGKTTTLNCALGLLSADSGSIEVLGTSASDIHATAGRVGVVFDRPTLVPGLSARQNLDYALRTLGHTGGRTPEQALELVGMGALAGRRVGRMSLGQTRRLSIARALLGHPELLVLDEPLSGLDTVGVGSMLALFRRLAADGLTIVVSSHRLPEMERIVSHVAIIVSGKLVTEGTLDAVLGGRERLLRVRATPVEAATRALAAMNPRREGDELLVPQGDGIARALVAAGCEVSALIPERATLLSVFESLVGDRSSV